MCPANNRFFRGLKLDVEYVLARVRAGEKRGIVTGGYLVKLRESQRLLLFATKGVKCVGCRRFGAYFDVVCDYDHQNSKFVDHLELMVRPDMIMTRDHVRPLSKGGGNTLANLQPMCFACNHVKADDWTEEGSL